MIWAIVGGVLVAMFVSGCDKGDDNDDATNVGGDSDAGNGDADAVGGDGDAPLVDEDTTAVPDAKNCQGINGEFSYPTSTYHACPAGIDLKMSGDRLYGACGPNYTGVFWIDVDAEDPTASTYATVKDGPQGFIVGQTARIASAQAIEFDGGYLVPFTSVDKPLGVNGISYVDESGALETKLFESPIADEDVAPFNPRSAAVVANADGTSKLVILASDANADGQGVLLSYQLNDDGSFDRHAAAAAPGRLEGKLPTAMAMIDGAMMALNAGGPTIEFFDVAEGSTLGDPVAVGEKIVALPQIALTEDNAYAVIPGVSGALHVFDVAARAFVGSLAGTEPARGVAIRKVGAGAYDVHVSFANSVSIFEGVDLANPASAEATMQIGIGTDLGPIAVNKKSGIIYVSATGRWWEEAEVAKACEANDSLAVCKGNIIAIDPSKLPVGAWSEEEGIAEICPRVE